ncbi:hypothetical protein [Algoriphagus zhangzhouensis]|uniref:Uncharacterized protein n=1 Tax=Algoriphagus zhangzhouensis TaxID=1073327 RepID=A0A1M7ZGN4_9BACT|nr:hypothetical protein [Algoriphagus zhangzhouensis]TDY44684.1 hypothetical protein A8938_2891 [Algoriphagus zhangzhouensis]SHO64024.1 hypothetical protein SAMN04488108_3194 [Algoriphagus zhangzhouensis]
MNKSFFLLALIWVLVVPAFGQSNSLEVNNLERYKEELPYFQELITGGQYTNPPQNYEGYPYLLGKSFELGTLTINQIYYPEVLLLYDIRYDQLITLHPIFSQNLLIKPEKINGFSLSNLSSFQRLIGNESYLYNQNGFYEIIEEGKMNLISKHYKTVVRSKELGDYFASYEEFEDFFFYDGSEFFPVTSKKKAIQLLDVPKKSVRENIIKRGIYFNRDKREFLKSLVLLSNTTSSNLSNDE